jgi:hypothetical protein
MAYVLVVWIMLHRHVFEMHAIHEGAQFFPSYADCIQTGEMLTYMEMHKLHRHVRYACEMQL